MRVVVDMLQAATAPQCCEKENIVSLFCKMLHNFSLPSKMQKGVYMQIFLQLAS